VAVASARLCRRLHFDPSVRIRPVSESLEVLALIDLDGDVRDLIGRALEQRPEIKAAGANLAATQVRLRQEVARPFLPSLYLGFSGGGFGGGSNLVPPLVGNFGGRADFDVAAYWTLANLGFGNLVAQKERRAMVGAAAAHQARTIALVRQEVASAWGDALARREQVEIARERLATAADGFHRDLERARQAVPDHLGRLPLPIEVINSLKLLVEARRKLVETIIDYDQAQFQLLVAMGSPPPLEQPTDPDHPSVVIRALAAPVTESRGEPEDAKTSTP
jgi:outer membrane protein TolC